MFKTRILLGLVLVSVISAVLWLDHRYQATWGFAGILVLVCTGGLYEYARLLSRPDLRLPAIELALLGGAFLLLQIAQPPHGGEYLLPLVALVVVLLLSEGVFRGDPNRSESAVLSIAGLVYVCFLASFVTRIRFFDGFGEAAFFWFLAVNKVTDSGAFFAGKTLGRRKLCPNVSPGKTWEGSFGGTIAGVGAGMVVWSVSPMRDVFPWWAILLAAIPASVSGQVGDLVESLFKRKAGQKDSGALLPQFGGFLDLLDCLLLSAPFSYYALLWMPRVQ
ncbi:MAG: phosphatidate cytidylyltransferase [Planctomycetota bacterium]